MKKITLTAAALLVFAGSTFSVNAATPAQASAKVSKLTVKTNIIPPGCPPSDPNGCGILD